MLFHIINSIMLRIYVLGIILFICGILGILFDWLNIYTDANLKIKFISVGIVIFIIGYFGNYKSYDILYFYVNQGYSVYLDDNKIVAENIKSENDFFNTYEIIVEDKNKIIFLSSYEVGTLK